MLPVRQKVPLSALIQNRALAWQWAQEWQTVKKPAAAWELVELALVLTH